MSKNDLMIMGVSGLAVFLLYGFLSKKGAGSPTYANDYSTKLISQWAGWSYYTDGTVTGPDGSYYKNGVKRT